MNAGTSHQHGIQTVLRRWQMTLFAGVNAGGKARNSMTKFGQQGSDTFTVAAEADLIGGTGATAFT